MKSKKIFLIFLGLVAIIFVIAAGLNSKLTNLIQAQLCSQENGKWASNGNHCITRDCIRDKSCLPNYRNKTVCKTLELGIDKTELFFHLGMPIKSNENTYIFDGGGAEKPILAILENDRVTELDCDPP